MTMMHQQQERIWPITMYLVGMSLNKIQHDQLQLMLHFMLRRKNTLKMSIRTAKELCYENKLQHCYVFFFIILFNSNSIQWAPGHHCLIWNQFCWVSFRACRHIFVLRLMSDILQSYSLFKTLFLSLFLFHLKIKSLAEVRQRDIFYWLFIHMLQSEWGSTN